MSTSETPLEYSGNSGGLEGELRTTGYVDLRQQASCQIQALRLMELHLYLRSLEIFEGFLLYSLLD